MRAFERGGASSACCSLYCEKWAISASQKANFSFCDKIHCKFVTSLINGQRNAALSSSPPSQGGREMRLGLPSLRRRKGKRAQDFLPCKGRGTMPFLPSLRRRGRGGESLPGAVLCSIRVVIRSVVVVIRSVVAALCSVVVVICSIAAVICFVRVVICFIGAEQNRFLRRFRRAKARRKGPQ